MSRVPPERSEETELGKMESCNSFLQVVDFKLYSLEEIEAATHNFHPSRIIGIGSQAVVYSGILHPDEAIAVKKFHQNPWKQDKKDHLVMGEMERVAAINHKNIVHLKGFCLQGTSPLLVYTKYQSLRKALYEEPNNPLNWESRYKIALGVARGLAYLHSGSRRPILHSAINPSNIMLDLQKFDSYIGDFCLAQLLQHCTTLQSSQKLQSSSGYSAPEVDSAGYVSAKSDVYSFGKLLYALISGKKHVETLPHSLIRTTGDNSRAVGKLGMCLFPWIKVLSQRSTLEYLDPLLQNEVKCSGRAILQASTVLRLIVLCTQDDDAARPDMERVAMELESANLCDVPFSVKAAAGIGLEWARLAGAVIYTIVVTAVVGFMVYVSHLMIPRLRGWKGGILLGYHVVIVGMVLYISVARLWWALNGVDEMLLWSPDDYLRLGWKRYHHLA